MFSSLSPNVKSLLTIVVICVFLLMFSFMLYTSKQYEVENLSHFVARNLSISVKDKIVSNILSTPFVINDLNVNSLLEGDINYETLQGIPILYQQLHIYPYTNYVYCALEENNTFIGISKSNIANNLDVVIQLSSNSTSNYILTYNYSDRLNIKSTAFIKKSTQTYFPNKRPWYTKAKSLSKSVWSNVYIGFIFPLPTITASTPFYDENNNFLGVCATDIVLDLDLSRLLSTINMSSLNKLFIVDSEYNIISNFSASTSPDITSYNYNLTKMTDTFDPFIKHIYNSISSQNNIYKSSSSIKFKYQDSTYFLNVDSILDKYSLNWLLITVVKKYSFGPYSYDLLTRLLIVFLCILGAFIFKEYIYLITQNLHLF